MAAKDREEIILRPKIRASRRSDPLLDEDSAVIHLEAKQQAELRAASRAPGSVPSPARGIGYVLDKIPPGQRVWVVLILALVFVALAGGSGWLASVKGWLAF